jgi:hypothetical protein
LITIGNVILTALGNVILITIGNIAVTAIIYIREHLDHLHCEREPRRGSWSPHLRNDAPTPSDAPTLARSPAR